MKGIFKQPISSEISLGALLLLAYIVGLMARILIFSFSIFRMINLANNKLIGVMDSYKLIPIDRPIVAGSFFRSIFLGVLFEKLSSQEKEIILRHEKIHLDQAHTFDLILVELISILFWFNPVIRLVKKSLRNVHEYCTDQVVSKNATTSYSELLLSLASDCKEYSIGHNFSAFQLKKRIMMLSKKRTSRFHLSKMVLLIPVIAGLLFSFSQTTKERDISLYFDGVKINLKEGLKISQLIDPANSEFRYTIKSAVIAKLDQDLSTMKMTLVRQGKGVATLSYNGFEESKIIYANELFTAANVGDHLVIEWDLEGNNISYSPRIMSLPINDG